MDADRDDVAVGNQAQIKIKVRASFRIVRDIKAKMTNAMDTMFRQTCFGIWLDVSSIICDSLMLLNVAQHQMPCDNPKEGIRYVVGTETLIFGPKQFCLITGLRFGKSNRAPQSSTKSFKSRIFPAAKRRIKLAEVQTLFEGDLTQYSNEDAVRICLLILLEMGFKGTQRESCVDDFLFDLVDDFKAWNEYPWGNYLWESTYSNVYDMHLRKKESKRGYSLNGFVWAFKIWIFEVFPEFRLNREYYLQASIPRFLSWGPGTKIMRDKASRILSNSIKIPAYLPVSALLPTPEEMHCDFYTSSCHYLADVAKGQVRAFDINKPFMGDATQPVGDLQESKNIPQGYYNADSGVRFDNSANRKKRRSDALVVLKAADFENNMIQKFKSLLEDYTKKLTDALTEKIIGQVDKIMELKSRIIIDMLNDKLVTSPEVPKQEGDINSEKTNHVEVRRTTRQTKHASYLRSPFMVIKKATEKPVTEALDVNNINDIMSWYPTAGIRNLGLCQSSPVGPDFWGELLGLARSGWLSSQHLAAWTTKLYYSRRSTDRWTILPSWFQQNLLHPQPNITLQCYYDGSEPPYPPVSDVDEVYVPLCIKDSHWFLGVFNLMENTLTIYDSLAKSGGMVKATETVICHINFAFEMWLRNHGYNADKPLSFAFPYKVVIPDNVPQQSGPLSDCGVWVCMFLERLVNKQPVSQEEDTQVTADRMRHRLARVFYDSILPLSFDLQKATDEMEIDDLEIVAKT